MKPGSSASTHFQRLLLSICVWFLYGFVVVEIIDLTYAFSRAVVSPEQHGNRLLLSKDEVSGFSAVFLTILISLELAETLKLYLHSHAIRIQLILLVGLTAITRHLLAADLKQADAMLNFSLAALVIALAGAYFLIERSPRPTAHSE